MSDQDKYRLAKYTIIEKVGQGGMAEVYKAIDKDSNRVVAIKFMRAALRSDDLNALRFKREAETLAQLEHPHIVEVYEFSQTEDKTYYLVLEFINGPTLYKTLKELTRNNELMPLERIRQLINQLGSALKYTHALGIIHRDIKPDNIMLREDEQVVLTDFGLAKLVQTQNSLRMTTTGAIVGTPAYMSPEQALGNEGDARADIYSLGVVLFQLATGQLPFEGASVTAMLLKIVNEPPSRPSSINPLVPADLDEIILKSLAKDPSERFQSVDELLAAVGVSSFDQTVVDMQALMDTQLIKTALDQEIIVEALLSNPFQAPPLPANFVGRHDELRKIKQLLIEGGHPLVGLVGFGGAGKSAVAALIGHNLRAAYPDGVLWAYLDATDSVENVLHSFASAFKQTAEIGRLPDLPSKASYVRDLLADKQVLVILDYVTDKEQVKWLRPLGPKNQTIITTRDGSLLKDLEAEVVPIKAFNETDSLIYFERVLGEHRVTNNLSYAKEITKLVDGLPLALSILAGSLAGSADFSMEDCVELLKDEQERLGLLSNSSDSVEASFELSYKVLTKREQMVFRALGALDGPDFDSLIVSAVTDLRPVVVRRILNKLYLTSVLSAGLGKRNGYFPIDTDGNGRYRLNLLLKTYAKQKLGDQLETTSQRIINYYAQFAEDHQQPDQYDALDLEWHNIFAAARWAYQSKQVDLVIQIALAVTHNYLGQMGYADQRGHYQDVQSLLRWALDVNDAAAQPLVHINLLTNLGGFSYRRTELEEAEEQFAQSEALLNTQPESLEATQQLLYLANLYALTLMRRDGQAALRWIERGLDAALASNDQAIEPERGVLLVTLSTVLANMGQFTEATEAATKALTLLPTKANNPRITALRNLSALSAIAGSFEQSELYSETAIQEAKTLGNLRELVIVHTNQATAAQRRNDYAKALELFEQLAPIQSFLGAPWVKGGGQNTLGTILTKLGQEEEAEQHFEEALRIAKEHNLQDAEAYPRVNFAHLLLLQQRPDEAAPHLARAADIINTMQLDQLQPELTRLQATRALMKQDVATAQDFIEQSLKLSQEQNNTLEEGQSWRVQGNIYAEQDAQAEAAAAYEKSLTLLSNVPYELAKTQLALAYLSQSAELAQQAAEAFRQLRTQRERRLAEHLLGALGG